MSRVAVFASYSKDGVVEDYVLYFLRELGKCVDAIVFVADNSAEPSEQDKVRDLVTYASFAHHGGHDFGSYRRGFMWLEEHGLLREAEELLFVNDSCYGPVYPFEEMFDAMSGVECDFWGMTMSRQLRRHIQSYFYVFRKKVFLSEDFRSMVLSFEPQPSWLDYVEKYETRITERLMASGYREGSYMEVVLNRRGQKGTFGEEDPQAYPETLTAMRMPLLKRKLFIPYFERALRESLMAVLAVVEADNEVLYGIMTEDIRKMYARMCGTAESVSVREWMRVLCRYGDEKSVLSVLAAERSRGDSLERKEMEWRERFVEKNRKHLWQIRVLIAACAILMAVCVVNCVVLYL